MNRVVWFIICIIVGLELMAWGLLVPAHIGAVDAQVLEVRGGQGTSLTGEGLTLINQEKLGPARMLWRVAEQTEALGRDRLAKAIRQYEDAHPKSKVWGGSALYLEKVFERSPIATNLQSRSVIDLLVPSETRESLFEALHYSRSPGVLDILETRNWTNTAIFSPVRTASGQPLDATIGTVALLFQQDQFSPELRNAIQSLLATFRRETNTQPMEEFYLDMLALGKRLDWVQLVELIKTVPDLRGLHEAGTMIREHEKDLPVIYSAIHFAGAPYPIARYLEAFPASGLKDLTYGLRCGAVGVRTLTEKLEPIHFATVRPRLLQYEPVQWAYRPLADLTARQPWMGFALKYALCLLGALFLGKAATYLSPALTEETALTHSWMTGPQVAMALCFLAALLFFTETVATRAAPAKPFAFRVKFPVPTAALRATIPHHQASIMTDKYSAASLVFFFIMQATIYVFCRAKLAEIRRENMPSKLKIRLLENEETLFDAGLYFGFVGTVVSLILVSIGIVKPSLMAAYSSTSFGIIFVSILKIFHVRPYRRRLILDAEMNEEEVQVA